MAEWNHQRAIEDYSELQRRISVGAYSERSAEHFESGTYPEDGVEEGIDNLTELAAKDGLEFCWHKDSSSWSLEPMSEETRTARAQAQAYQPPEKDSLADWYGDFERMHE